VRSWLVVVGIAAALLAALGVYLIVGARLTGAPGALPPAPAAHATAALPAPAPPPAPPAAPAAEPAAPPAAEPATAPPAPAATAAREQAVAERTAARELAAAERRVAADRKRAERAVAAKRVASAQASRPPRAAPAPAPAPAAPAQPPARPEDPDRPLLAELTGAISGRLVDERGAPLGATPILALATDGGDGEETFTDDDGAFLIAGLRPGRYVVFTGLGSALAGRLGARGVDVGAAQVARLEVRELPRGGTVRVSAVDAEGRPAVGEAILVAGAPGAGGSFGPLLGQDLIWLPGLGADRMLLQKVPPGTYTVVLLLEGARSTARAAQDPVVVSEGDVAVNVRLGREVPQG
jgi:hypothetical protein